MGKTQNANMFVCISEGLFVCQNIRYFFKQQSSGCSETLGLGSLVAPLTTNTVWSQSCEAEVGNLSSDKVDTKMVSRKLLKIYWPWATR